MENRRPKLSVILPTFNRASLLEQALRAYDGTDLFEVPFEVLVIDDGSTDTTPDVLRAFRPQRYTLRRFRQRNSGPAAARNRGIDEARGDIIVFVGDDIVPHAGLLRQHWRRHVEAADPLRTAVLGPVHWHPREPLTTVMATICAPGGEQFSYSCFTDGQQLDFRRFYTCNISVPRQLLGGHRFLTCFDRAAFEDTELGYRLATSAGMKIVYAAAAGAFHIHRHTAASFSRRQDGCGRMASVFCRLRPAAAWATRRGYFLGLSAAAVVLSRLRGSQTDSPVTLGNDLIALAACYDEVAVPRLQQLHHALFAYAYFRGFAMAEFNLPEAHSFFHALLFLTTARALERFLQMNDPPLSPERLARLRRLPRAYPRWTHTLLDRLQRIGSRLFR